MKRFALYAGVTAMVLGISCSKNDAGGEVAAQGEILLQSNIAPGSIESEVVSKGTGAGVIQGDNSTPALTVWFARADQNTQGVYGTYGTTALEATRAAAPGTTATALVFVAGKQYYMPGGKKTKMRGWYPQETAFANGIVSWTTDGSHDIMTTDEKEGNSDPTGAMPPFAFDHKLAQLQFYIYAENADVNKLWGKIKRISVIKQKQTCEYTLATGAVAFTGSADKSFDAYKDPTGFTAVVSKAAATAVAGAPVMVEPQDATYKLTLEVESENGGTTVEMAPQNFDESFAYKIYLKLTAKEITPTATIGSWNATTSVDVVL